MKADGHEIIRDANTAVRLLANDEDIAADLETGGLISHRDPVAVVSLYGEQTSTLAVLHVRGVIPDSVKTLLSDPTKRFTWHNGVCFDIPFLLNNGVRAADPRIYDTIVGAGLAITTDRAGQSKSLQAEIKRRTGIMIEKDADHSSWMNRELDDKQLLYCCDDLVHAHALRRAQEADIAKQRQTKALALEMAIVGTVAKMTYNGLPLSVSALDEFRVSQATYIAEATEYMTTTFGETNVNSSLQIKNLMVKLGMKIPKTVKFVQNKETGKKERQVKESTGADLLQAIADKGLAGIVANGIMEPRPNETDEEFVARAEGAAKMVGTVVKLREATKRVGMYNEEWITKFRSKRGRIHAQFRQAGTATLRFACSEPNMQAWPKDMRGVIGGEPGMKIVSSDFSQIEVVIAAELANDSALLSLIEKGGDTHAMVAAYCLNKNQSAVTQKERRAFKSGNFCLIFGGSPETLREYALAKGAVDLTPAEAQQIHDIYFEKFPGLRKKKELAQERANDRSRQVVEIRLRSGGVRHLLRSEGKLKSTTILNTEVQGNAAAGMKFAILEAKNAGLDMYLSATVHDELVGVVPTQYAEEYGRELQAAMIRGMAKILETPARTGLWIGNFWD